MTKLKEKRDKKFQVMLSESESDLLRDWMKDNDVFSHSEALRQLVSQSLDAYTNNPKSPPANPPAGEPHRA